MQDNTKIYQTEYRSIKKVLRIMHGKRSSTPSIVIPNFHALGLLYLINEKQAHVQQIIQQEAESEEPMLQNMESLASVLEFMNFVSGGMIVEAERVDELCIQLKKNMVSLRKEYDSLDMDLNALLQQCAAITTVQYTLANHFGKSNKTVLALEKSGYKKDSRGGSAVTGNGTEALRNDVQLLTFALEEKKRALATAKEHLSVATKIQQILHGQPKKLPSQLTSGTSEEDIVYDLPVLLSIRKAQHSVRDATYDVRKNGTLQPALPAITRFQEFLEYVAWGVSSVIDDLETSELKLRKWFRAKPSEAILAQLELKDVTNKRMSCAALRYNQSTSMRNSRSHARTVLDQPPSLLDTLGEMRTPTHQESRIRPRDSPTAVLSPVAREQPSHSEVPVSSIGIERRRHDQSGAFTVSNGSGSHNMPNSLRERYEYTPPSFLTQQQRGNGAQAEQATVSMTTGQGVSSSTHYIARRKNNALLFDTPMVMDNDSFLDRVCTSTQVVA